MKRFLLPVLLALATMGAHAQLQYNPQLGATFQNLTDEPSGLSYKAKVGWLLGLDVRIGETFYLQPGVFYGQSATTLTTADTLGNVTNSVENDLVRTFLKLRVMGGWKLINGDAFKLRLAVGPSYDFLLNVDDQHDVPFFDKDNFTSGSFNLDVGVGLDIAFITIEPGVSFGLSQVYEDNILTQDIDSKYLTFYLTAGLVFGKGR